MQAWNTLHPEDAPVADGYSIVTEFDGRPRCVVRTTWLDQRPLREVDAVFAWDEGEGDRTLADWMDGHRRYFGRVCPSLGIAFSDDLPVVLERFELLYPFDAALNPVDCGPRIVPGWLPGAVGAIAAMHATYYSREHGFGVRFEAKVAAECAAFCARLDPARDGLWLLVDGGRIAGSIVIDGSDVQGAHLRWFIVGDELRGRGFGARLLEAALGFCRRAGHRSIHLTTFAGLDAARALYERSGFRLVHEADSETWGTRVREQRFEARA
jgi:GNAT superfamily N-acetyltransferase